MALSGGRASEGAVIIFLPREIQTGGQKYLAEVYSHLRRNGVRVEPVYDDIPANIRRLGLILDCLVSNFWFFRQVIRLGDSSNAIFFEDFHLHPRLWLFNEMMRVATGRLKTVVLMQSSLFYHHTLQRAVARKLDECLVRIFFRQASKILTNSEFTRQEVISLGINPAKVEVIYCGYQGELKPRRRLDNLQKSPDDGQHILFVGQCAAIKGIEYLLHAISMLPHDRVILHIVGNTEAEPDYYLRLIEIVEKHGLQDKVIFHGHVSDKAKLSHLYERADLFVLPSLVEGFGIVLLEAMSFGLPIVATRVGAIPELIEDGVNGKLVPPADAEALSTAMETLLTSPDLRKMYSQNGYAFVADRRHFYSWEAVGERVLRAIQPLLGQ